MSKSKTGVRQRVAVAIGVQQHADRLFAIRLICGNRGLAPHG
jgi:hypothetical protein